ncbi:MAG: hypothetical protein HKN17_08395 [Rhodothermales bacterium]|nr:hypothetical protein [Rhodothermales bacterium]
MMNHRTRPPLFLSALCALMLFSLSSEAEARQTRMDMESMKEVSEAVVLARTVSTESFWNDSGTAILTRVTLQVTDRLSGQAGTETEIIVPGGQVGDYLHEVSDMPSFTVNEESVVFIERHRSGTLIVAGGNAGKLDVSIDPVTGIRTVPGGVFGAENRAIQNAGKGGETADPPARMSIEDLKSRLRE